MRCGVLVRMMSVEALGDLTQIAAMCVGTYGLSLACLRQTNHTPWKPSCTTETEQSLPMEPLLHD